VNFLIDTHVLIWMTIEPDRLSESVSKIVQNRKNSLFLSMASIWEMQIKLQIGKLTLRLPLDQLIEDQSSINGVNILNIKASHVYGLSDLPLVHKDPFDRMLISQSRAESMPLLSIDGVFDGYPVHRIWD
jgi:PIN domain nuclease of toxin-antitoxin system